MIIEVKDVEALITRLADMVSRSESGEDAVSILEDVADTLHEYAAYKDKYEENDKAWRKRYTERFMSGEDPVEGEEDIEESETLTFDELFEEEK